MPQSLMRWRRHNDHTPPPAVMRIASFCSWPLPGNFLHIHCICWGVFALWKHWCIGWSVPSNSAQRRGQTLGAVECSQSAADGTGGPSAFIRARSLS